MTGVVSWQSAAFLGTSCISNTKCNSATYKGNAESKTTRLYKLEAEGSGTSKFIFGALELDGMSNAPCPNGSYHDICVTNMSVAYDQITPMPVDDISRFRPDLCPGVGTLNDTGQLYYYIDNLHGGIEFSDSIVLVDKNYCQHRASINPSNIAQDDDNRFAYGFCLQNTNSQQKCGATLGSHEDKQENNNTTPWYYWLISLVIFIIVIGFASLLVWFHNKR